MRSRTSSPALMCLAHLCAMALYGCAATAASVVPAHGEAPPVATMPAAYVDMHVHVEFDADRAQGMSSVRPPTPEAVRALLEDARVAHVGVIVIAPPDIDATREQNDALLALVATDPRLFAIASVHPAQGQDALDEIDRVAAAGARMLKLHQNTQHFDLSAPEVGPILDRAAERGLPVLFEGTATLDPGTFGKFIQLAVTHPRARIVLAHMGFADFRQLLVVPQLASYPWWPNNIYFDLSATAAAFADSPMRDELAWTIRRLGTDRVMFGSDFPVSTPQETLDAVARLGFDEAELQAICHDNAVALLSLE